MNRLEGLSMRFFSILLISIISLSTAVFAETIKYDLVKGKSVVGFTYMFGANPNSGQFVNYDADIAINFENASKSKVDVILRTDTAKAGFAFATSALRSKSVLHAKAFPDIRFISKSVRASKSGAIIDGIVTVRGVSKPLSLNAVLLRDPGTKASERNNLRMRITGRLNRHDFGASGYPNQVGENLDIKIDARIKRK